MCNWDETELSDMIFWPDPIIEKPDTDNRHQQGWIPDIR